MQQIFRAGVFESLKVVVEKRTDRASERDDGNSSRRFKARNQSDQIANQNEDKNNGEKRRIGLAVMPNDLLALAEDESFDAFERVLQAAGRIDRKARPNQQKDTSRKEKTSNSIAKEFEIGAAGYFGSICSAPQKGRGIGPRTDDSEFG